jgi:hypothetical protein
MIEERAESDLEIENFKDFSLLAHFETEKIDDYSNECDIESLISKPFNRDIDRQSKRSKNLMIDLPVFNLSRENTIFTHYSEK